MAKTDEKTLALIQEVQNRKKEIKKLESRWAANTNCSFSFVEGHAGVSNVSSVINLRTVTSIPTLISIVSFLLDKEKSYKEAVELLEINEAPEFKWGGFTVRDWAEDVKTRVGKIQLDSKKKKLEELETRLNKIVSPELRAEMELEAIARELQ
jgi:hypothetical protein